MTVVPDDDEFALLLTHDVDRPFKTYQFPYYAIRDWDLGQIRSGLAGENPFWTFDDLCALEDNLGVRSSFNFLDERRLFNLPVKDWLSPENWRLFLGRYSITDPAITDLVRRLESGGWEIGLHGSYYSYRDRNQLEREKVQLESMIDGDLLGGRQHYLNLDEPETWRHQQSIGLKYDTSPGSNETYGFDGEYDIRRPFDDDFVVFPLTVMETALPDPGDSFEEAWRALDGLLDEAAENDAVMSVLWHPRFFAEEDFPGHRPLYRRLIEAALDRGAWVGSPGAFYTRLDHPTDDGGAHRTVDGGDRNSPSTDDAKSDDVDESGETTDTQQEPSDGGQTFPAAGKPRPQE